MVLHDTLMRNPDVDFPVRIVSEVPLGSHSDSPSSVADASSSSTLSGSSFLLLLRIQRCASSDLVSVVRGRRGGGGVFASFVEGQGALEKVVS